MAEITASLTVVDKLFAGSFQAGDTPKAEWGERQHFVSALGLHDEERLAQIPCLNDVKMLEALPPFSLVRYRGLVQDLFEPELYTSLVEECGADGQSSQVRTTKYRECMEPGQ